MGLLWVLLRNSILCIALSILQALESLVPSPTPKYVFQWVELKEGPVLSIWHVIIDPRSSLSILLSGPDWQFAGAFCEEFS